MLFTDSFLQYGLLLYPVAGSKAIQIALDKGIQRTVHNRIDVGGFAAGAGILDEGIGHEDIVTDLAAPLDLLLDTLDVGNVCQMLTLTDLNQLGSQHAQTGFLVLELAAFGLAGNNDTGLVDQTDCRGGLSQFLHVF